MSKNILYAALLLAGILFAACPASAQVYAGGTQAIEGSQTGTWNVYLQQGTDANGTYWEVQISSPNPSTLGLEGVQLRFFDQAATPNPNAPGFQQANGNVQNIVTQSATGGTGGTLGSPANSFLNESFTTRYHFEDPNGMDTITASNPFEGKVYLAPGDSVASIQVIINDGGSSTNAYNVITPEGSSLALLLPGLIPMGIGLKRRWANRAKQ